MSRVLITGATGLVGGHLLQMLNSEARITSIVAATRRPITPMNKMFNLHDPQLRDALAQATEPVDIVFCCLAQPCVKQAAKKRLCLRITRWWWNRINRAAPGSTAHAGGQRYWRQQ